MPFIRQCGKRVESTNMKQPENADTVSEYCETHTRFVPQYMLDHWNWTSKKFSDADKMSSLLQVSLTAGIPFIIGIRAELFLWI